MEGLSFQSLYNMPPGMEVPWRTYQEFGNLVGNATHMIVEGYTGTISGDATSGYVITNTHSVEREQSESGQPWLRQS